MKINYIKYPTEAEYAKICERPQMDVSQLNSIVAGVLADIKANGDKAVKAYEEKFDKVQLDSLAVTEAEIAEAEKLISPELKDALILAHKNIAAFHEAQQFAGKKVETAPGVVCWQKSVAIEKVGLYIPGGTAPLFSTVLMLATPAKIAGCKEIVLCTPPGKQAIGAMAYGTESVPKVYKIFGPGNQFVMAAKQQVSLHDVAIDMPAGPSEVCVIADETSNPVFVAADLLSQAEHGADSQVILISTSEEMIEKVSKEVERQLALLPRSEMAEKSLSNSQYVLVKDKEEAMALSNAYAPEHLIIATNDYEELAEKVINAGSVFLGSYACESAGDYASGTNHTLPTHGYAVAYNGVNLDSYNRKVTFQHLTKEGIKSIGNAVVCMAENEQLEAHANAMRLRVKAIDN